VRAEARTHPRGKNKCQSSEKTTAKTELLEKLGNTPTLRLGKRAVKLEWIR